MSYCGKCEKDINRLKREHIICENCGLFFHRKCVFLNYEDNATTDLNKEAWKCLNCLSKKDFLGEATKIALSCFHSSSVDTDRVDILEKLLGKYQINCHKQMKVDNIKKSLNTAHAKLDHNAILLTSMQTLIKQQQEIIDKLMVENNSLRRELYSVKSDLKEVESEADNVCERLEFPVNGNKSASLHNSPLQKAESGGKYKWKVGDKCMAKYWEDNMYYNAEVTGISKKTCVVRFLEYGNFEEVLQDDCIPISEEPIENINLQNNEHSGFNNNRSNHFSGSIEFRRGGTRPYIKPEANSGGRKPRYSQPMYVPPASRREAK